MKNKILFWMILCAGIFTRLYFVWSAPYAYIHRDNCTIWLMARHILEGDIPLFFYGQYYLGPMEALGVASFFMLFGIKASTLCLGTIFYSAIFIISAYLLGKELKDKVTGLFVMLFSAFPSWYFFYESIAPLGYHIEIPFLGNFILLLALRIPQINPGGRKLFLYTLIGICSGLGIWTHYIIIYYLVPAFVYMVINEKWKHLIKYFIPTAISFFLIALPFWIFTFKYNFVTFSFSKSEAFSLDFSYLKEMVKCFLYMFNLEFVSSRAGSILKGFVIVLYIIASMFFISASILRKRFIFNKKSIIVYFFIFMVFLFVYYKSSRSCGLGYNYILPILTFISAVFGYLCACIYNKNKLAGLAVFSFIFCFNSVDIGRYISSSQSASRTNEKMVFDKIKYLEENNFYRIVGYEWDFREPIFFSNEKIIATGYTEYHYNKYADIVDMSDHVVFENPGNELNEALKNICLSYDVKDNYFYNFKPHPYKMKIIDPAAWTAWANVHTQMARYAFDRCYNNFWAGNNEGDNDICFTIDLGKLYKVCKIAVFDPTISYTPNFKIQGSINGIDWFDIASISNIQPLFWSGPRPCWHHHDGRIEYYFKPVDTRFIRLIKADKTKNRWVINEIYIYEYCNDQRFSKKDYVKDAYSITKFLLKKSIDFVYADFWMSAKIRGITKNKIETLDAYNTFLPPRKHMSRDVNLNTKKAFVIKNEDKIEVEQILNELNLPFRKNQYKNYNCYYFSELDEGIESSMPLEWIGIGVVKKSIASCGKWYYKCAERMAEKGNHQKAIFYYKKAVKYFFGDIGAYLKVINYYKQIGALNEYLKLKRIISEKLTPEYRYDIKFNNGAQFLGWGARYDKFAVNSRLNINYYWKVNRKINDRVFVFVYFIKDEKIIFQNDHRLLERYDNPDITTEGGTWKESCKITVPSSVQTGEYTVKIGLWVPDKSGKRVRIRGSKSSLVEIGKVRL